MGQRNFKGYTERIKEYLFEKIGQSRLSCSTTREKSCDSIWNQNQKRKASILSKPFSVISFLSTAICSSFSTGINGRIENKARSISEYFL